MSSRDLAHRSLLAMVLLSFSLGCCVAMETCNFSNDESFKESPSVKTNGNATLVGLFNLHLDGRQCVRGRPVGRGSALNGAAAQRMLAAVWAAEWLNERDVLGDGLTIGFEGLSACSDTRTALRKTIYSLNTMGILDGCLSNFTEGPILGYVGPADDGSSQAVSGLLTSLNIKHEPLHVTSIDEEIKAITSFLKHLQWKQIALIADNAKIQNTFHETAGRDGICVSESFLLTKHVNYTDIFPKIKYSGAQVIVFLGLDFQLRTALQASVNHAEVSDFYWLVAGPTVHNGFRLLPDIDPPTNHQRIFFVQVSQSKVPGFQEYLQHLPESVTMNEDVTDVIESCYKQRPGETPDAVRSYHGHLCAPILNNDVLAVAESVSKLTERYRNSRNACSIANRDNETSTECPAIGGDMFQVPQLLSDQLNVSVMAYQIGPQRVIRFVEVGLYSNKQLVLKTEDLGILHDVGGGWFRAPRFKCPSCPCLNNPDRSLTYLTDFWLVAPWYAGCGTVASLCALVAIAVGVFITVRLCRGDAMEGSQAFAYVLLFGIVFTCVSVVPFMLGPSPVVCNLRPIAVGLDYALMFSPMLARSLMLATSDTDGLLGHVSGLVQSALFFFMVAVQVALGIQQWVLMSEYGRNLQARFNGVECNVVLTDYAMSILYVSFLLACTVVITGLSVRNRRNYHEGLFFHIASLLVVLLWALFLSLFFLLEPNWQQPVLCCSIVSVASSILVVVFIPRVFKMYRAITLDTMNSGRNVGRCDVPSLTDVTTRTSNAMIYETVNHAYAPGPEPILVNGEGMVVKENASVPLETSTPNDGEPEEVTVEAITIIDPPPPLAEEEIPMIDEKDKDDTPTNETNGVAQGKPPTVTHL